ncbi:MAG: VOC family protein [Proteobacteria bacterium]|nr:VOC family protein [Pseudomonadota bacterium]
MQVQAYLFFEGQCEEALDFYQSALGAEVDMIMRFRENPDDPEQTMYPPGAEDKIMHASMRIGETTVLLSDGRCSGSPAFGSMSLTVTVPTEAEAERVYKALSEGGQIRMPLRRTFFSPAFGMVTDPFGVGWMIYAAG